MKYLFVKHEELENDPYMEKERGQSVVLLALALVGLLAFAGLAIDGGRILSERAHAQAAADAAAMAAVNSLCAGENPIAPAFELAESNGYANDGDYNTVAVNHPPTSGSYAGDNDYIEVLIDANLSGTLVSTVYSGPLALTVRAVSFCHSGTSGIVGGGNAIISLHPDMRKAFWGTGNGEVTVTSGGMYINSSNSRALESTGNGSITADTISIGGNWRKVGNGVISPSSSARR